MTAIIPHIINEDVSCVYYMDCYTLAGVNTITPLILHNDLRDPSNHDFLPNADLKISLCVLLLVRNMLCCVASK